MTQMLLTQIRKRIITKIKTDVPEFMDCDAHFGRMTSKEVMRISSYPPAMRAGIFGAIKSGHLPSGQFVMMPRFAIAIITREADLLLAHDTAMDLAVKTKIAISNWMVGQAHEETPYGPVDALGGVGTPEDITIDISADDSLDKEGVALLAVLFTLPIVMGENLAQQDGEFEVAIDGLDTYQDIELAG